MTGGLTSPPDQALAHLRGLEVEGQAEREVREGVYWYRAW
jgi:hypothetical protein